MEKLIISEERFNSPVSLTLLSLKGTIETTNARRGRSMKMLENIRYQFPVAMVADTTWPGRTF